MLGLLELIRINAIREDEIVWYMFTFSGMCLTNCIGTPRELVAIVNQQIISQLTNTIAMADH